jgi:hypothetical protein
VAITTSSGWNVPAIAARFEVVTGAGKTSVQYAKELLYDLENGRIILLVRGSARSKMHLMHLPGH